MEDPQMSRGMINEGVSINIEINSNRTSGSEVLLNFTKRGLSVVIFWKVINNQEISKSHAPCAVKLTRNTSSGVKKVWSIVAISWPKNVNELKLR